MVQLIPYINGAQVNPPKNLAQILVELNYGKDQFPDGNTISVTALEWVRENYDYIMAWIEAGKTGGTGLYEGPTFRFDALYGPSAKTVFDGYLDLKKGLQIKNKISVKTNIVSVATVDWVNQLAASVSFEYLASLPAGTPGAIDSSMYKFMPYVNSMIPNYTQSATSTLMVFAVSQAISKAVVEIFELVVDMANPFTAANAILKALIKIGYLIVLLATLIKMCEDVVKFIISPVKYHACMYARDLFQKGCEYMNMNFSSTIFAIGSPYYNEAVMPEKLYNPISKTDTQLFGFLVPDKNEQIGYFKYYFSDLIERMKTKCNAKIVVVAPVGGASSGNQGTVIFIRKDKNALPPQFVIPNLYSPDYTFNSEEINSSTLLAFQIDSQDMNTEQNYTGTSFEVVTTPINVTYQPFVTLTEYKEVNIQFARASTKTGLTIPEKIIDDFLMTFDAIANGLISVVNGLANIANAITGLINKMIRALKAIGIKLKFTLQQIPQMAYVHLANTITNRIGMMVLSNDHFNVPKVFILQEGSAPQYNKIDPSNDAVEDAEAHWFNFHYVDSMVPASINPRYSDRPTGNQFIKQHYPKVPFGWTEFNQVLANNRVFASDLTGNVIESILESLKFNVAMEHAETDVRIPYIFTLNLKETFLKPSGL